MTATNIWKQEITSVSWNRGLAAQSLLRRLDLSPGECSQITNKEVLNIDIYQTMVYI